MPDLDKNLYNPRKSQEQVLHKILKQLKGCRIAKDLDIEAVNDSNGFRRAVPITDFEFYHPYIQDILNGQESIMFHGSPVCIAQTGGSTSEPKCFPLGKHLIKSYRQFNLDMAFCYMRDSGNYNILSGKIFLVAASPSALQTKNGIPVGRATGIMAQIAPALLRRRYVPDLTVIRNPRTEQKIQQTNRMALKERHQIRVAAGLTPYLISALDNLARYAQEEETALQNISEILPHLTVAFHGGTAFNLYSDRLHRLTGDQTDHRNVYSAAEGPIAFQFSGSSSGLAPALDSVFFEFLPKAHGDRNQTDAIPIDEVECGIPYYILLTTQGGLLRYKIGDVVEFISTEPPLFKVLGRAEDQIDLSGEKIEVDQAIKALEKVSQTQRVKIFDFLVCPTVGGLEGQKIAHEWIIECDPMPEDLNVFRSDLEKYLFINNYRYKEIRERNYVLGQPDITFVPRGTFQHFMEAELIYGQQKMLHMCNNRTTAERLLAYAK